MGAIAHKLTVPVTCPARLTLLELVTALSEVTDDEKEVVATALYMLRTGRVVLRGSFRSLPLSEF